MPLNVLEKETQREQKERQTLKKYILHVESKGLYAMNTVTYACKIKARGVLPRFPVSSRRPPRNDYVMLRKDC